VACNVLTRVNERGICGFDMYGNEFGIFYAQIVDVKKVPMGVSIQLETGEEIKIDMCYNRINTMMYRGIKGD